MFTATFEEQVQAARIYGRRGITPTRWVAAYRTVWEGAADEWIPRVADLVESKGETIDAGLGEDLLRILTVKAEKVVVISEAEWAAFGIEGLETFEGAVASAANTEPTQALAWSQHETAAATQPDLRKIWQAVSDDRTRSTHLDAHGQERPINEPFDVGAAQLQWPAEVGGPDGEVINCRCWEEYTLGAVSA